MRYTYFIFLFLLLCYGMPASAQQPARTHVVLSPDDSLYNDFLYRQEYLAGERINMLFPALGSLTDINHEPFDFDHISRPAVIMIGFADCPPCRALLPVLLDCAANPVYKDVDFLYLTYDDTATIAKELGARVHKNLKIFSAGKRTILDEDNMLVVSFPTIYFIDRNGVVRRLATGSGTDNNALTGQRYKWRRYLELITTK